MPSQMKQWIYSAALAGNLITEEVDQTVATILVEERPGSAEQGGG